MITARSNGILIRKKPFKVLICLATAMAFLCNTVLFDASWAVGTPSELPGSDSDRAGGSGLFKELHVDTFTLPEYLGRIKDQYKANNPNKTIIHIQDAHCNYAAQRKISAIIEYLNKEYGVDTINLEGGAKDYDLSVFTNIIDKTIRDKVADYFVKEGLVSGAEYFAVNNPEKVNLWGIEDTKLYMDNLKVYRDSITHKEEVDKYLKTLSHILSNLKSKIYSKDLLGFDMKYGSYKSNNIEFKDYLSSLIATAKSKAINIKSLPNIYLLNQVLGEEGGIDFRKANNERDELINRLHAKLSKQALEELVVCTVEFRSEKISQKKFYSYLTAKAKQANLALNDLPELQKYIVYISMYDAIDKVRVMEEMDALENKVRDVLCRNDEERQLSALSKNLSLLKNIFGITLTKDDYKYYKANEESFGVRNFTAFINKNAPLYNITAKLDDSAQNLDQYRKEIERFYEYSLKRDDAFLKNLRLSQGSTNTAILVTGGFHTENLAELFKKQGISYISIMPNFRSSEGYECPYFGLLAGKATADNKKIVQALGLSSMAIASILNMLGEAANGKESQIIERAKIAMVTARVRKVAGIEVIYGKDTQYYDLNWDKADPDGKEFELFSLPLAADLVLPAYIKDVSPQTVMPPHASATDVGSKIGRIAIISMIALNVALPAMAGQIGRQAAKHVRTPAAPKTKIIAQSVGGKAKIILDAAMAEARAAETFPELVAALHLMDRSIAKAKAEGVDTAKASRLFDTLKARWDAHKNMEPANRYITDKVIVTVTGLLKEGAELEIANMAERALREMQKNGMGWDMHSGDKVFQVAGDGYIFGLVFDSKSGRIECEKAALEALNILASKENPTAEEQKALISLSKYLVFAFTHEMIHIALKDLENTPDYATVRKMMLEKGSEDRLLLENMIGDLIMNPTYREQFKNAGAKEIIDGLNVNNPASVNAAIKKIINSPALSTILSEFLAGQFLLDENDVSAYEKLRNKLLGILFKNSSEKYKWLAGGVHPTAISAENIKMIAKVLKIKSPVVPTALDKILKHPKSSGAEMKKSEALPSPEMLRAVAVREIANTEKEAAGIRSQIFAISRDRAQRGKAQQLKSLLASAEDRLASLSELKTLSDIALAEMVIHLPDGRIALVPDAKGLPSWQSRASASGTPKAIAASMASLVDATTAERLAAAPIALKSALNRDAVVRVVIGVRKGTMEQYKGKLNSFKTEISGTLADAGYGILAANRTGVLGEVKDERQIELFEFDENDEAGSSESVAQAISRARRDLPENGTVVFFKPAAGNLASIDDATFGANIGGVFSVPDAYSDAADNSHYPDVMARWIIARLIAYGLECEKTGNGELRAVLASLRDYIGTISQAIPADLEPDKITDMRHFFNRLGLLKITATNYKDISDFIRTQRDIASAA